MALAACFTLNIQAISEAAPTSILWDLMSLWYGFESNTYRPGSECPYNSMQMSIRCYCSSGASCVDLFQQVCTVPRAGLLYFDDRMQCAGCSLTHWFNKEGVDLCANLWLPSQNLLIFRMQKKYFKPSQIFCEEFLKFAIFQEGNTERRGQFATDETKKDIDWARKFESSQKQKHVMYFPTILISSATVQPAAVTRHLATRSLRMNTEAARENSHEKYGPTRSRRSYMGWTKSKMNSVVFNDRRKRVWLTRDYRLVIVSLEIIKVDKLAGSYHATKHCMRGDQADSDVLCNKSYHEVTKCCSVRNSWGTCKPKKHGKQKSEQMRLSCKSQHQPVPIKQGCGVGGFWVESDS